VIVPDARLRTRRQGAAIVVALLLLAVLAPSAGAATLSVHAASGGRVSVRLVGHVAPGAYDVVLDGRRVRRTNRRSFSLKVPRRAATTASARWRRLQVRRAGTRRLLASTTFAMAGATSRRAPTLVLLAAPPATGDGTTPVLRFSSTVALTACSTDGRAWRRCATPVTLSGLSPGAHAVSVRARNRLGSSTLSVAFTIAGSPPAPTATPAPPAAAPPSPGIAGRRLVFDDEFDGTAINTASWSRYNSAGNAGNGLRRQEALALDGSGHLVITAKMVNGQLVSGGMSNRLDLTYGYFEARVRTDPDPTGTMSGVVLTRPQSSNSPIDGENDIYETGADVNTRNPFHSYVHYGANNSQYYFAHNADGAQWHTMGMAWGPNAIDIYRDGVLVWTVSDRAAIPDVPHHICLQLDARFTRTLTTTVTMEVDYVRIYA
jgi:beta-glucanase (GH16 family)